MLEHRDRRATPHSGQKRPAAARSPGKALRTALRCLTGPTGPLRATRLAGELSRAILAQGIYGSRP